VAGGDANELDDLFNLVALHYPPRVSQFLEHFQQLDLELRRQDFDVKIRPLLDVLHHVLVGAQIP